jgi:hypothetical protein
LGNGDEEGEGLADGAGLPEGYGLGDSGGVGGVVTNSMIWAFLFTSSAAGKSSKSSTNIVNKNLYLRLNFFHQALKRFSIT